MRRVACVLATVASMVVTSGGIAHAAIPKGPASGADQNIAHARFEGRWVDLSRDWAGARACLVYPGRPTECFRTVQSLRVRETAFRSPDISCSAPLDLHNWSGQTGTLVSIYSRGLWINLSDLSFNNMTSSYTVGACAIELAANSGGGGSHYARCLYAWCVENVMATGWNNAVSSVYLH
jgi:hypothetical protein